MARISDTEQLIWQQTQTISELRSQLAAAERAVLVEWERGERYGGMLNQVRLVYLAFDTDEIATRDEAFRVVEDILKADDPDLLPRLGRETGLYRLIRVPWKSRRKWQEDADDWHEHYLTKHGRAKEQFDKRKEVEARLAKVREIAEVFASPKPPLSDRLDALKAFSTDILAILDGTDS